MNKRWFISFTFALVTVLLLGGCQAADTFQPIEGTSYAATVNGKEASFVLADNGESTLSYTDTETVTVKDLIGSVITDLDVRLSTKNETTSRCTTEKDGLLKIEYQHSYITLLIEGEDKDAFIKEAKESCQESFDKGNIGEETLSMYQTLLDGKTYHMDLTKEVKLWVFGTIDEASGCFKIKRQEQRTVDGQLDILKEFNENGVMVLKKRFNDAGMAVGVFEYDENGNEKKIVWYNDDGSLMNSEEYIRENGQLSRVIFLSEEDFKSVDLYKDGRRYRTEETHPNGITTYRDYDEKGNDVRYSAITGEGEDMIRVMEFIVRPDTGEALEIAGVEYDADGNVTVRYDNTYNDNYVMIQSKCTDNKGNVLFEEKRDDNDRVIYEFLESDKVKIYHSYDDKDADRVSKIYDLNGRLQSISKEKNEICFYSCHYEEDGSYLEEYSDATKSLYHYPLKKISYDRNGKRIKMTEYEPFFYDNGELIDSVPKTVSVYKNGVIETVTEYRNEQTGTFINNTPIKISHYENGVLVHTEDYS